METKPSQPPSLSVVDELEYAVWKATVLKTALELDIFSVLAQGHLTLSDILAKTRCSERGLRTLLDALCPLGLLAKHDDGYALTPISDAYLVRGRPTYYGDFCLQTQLAWETRARAAEAVRTGTAVGGDFSKPETEGLWAIGRAPAMLDWPEAAVKAREMWDTLGIGPATRPGLHILDVACGSAVKSLVLAQADADVRVTALDLPQVLEVAATVAAAMGVSEQVTFVPGDVIYADLGYGLFDVILFGSILYYFPLGQRADILKRALQALRGRGFLVINEVIADEARCQGELALMAAFQLLLFAPQSQVYTFSEYQELLGKIGFAQVKQHNEQLISAVKEA